MSDMVIRVAKALWEQRRKYSAEKDIPLEEWGNGRLPSFNGVFEEARAAIEAMREPTGDMLQAAMEHKGQQSYSDVWSDMVRAILK